MPWLDVPSVGQFYQARNKKLSNQNTVNFYPHFSKDGNSRVQVSLEPIPGNLLFGSAGTGKNRGAQRHKDQLFVVNGTELYEFNSSGIATLIGTIPGSNRVDMETDGTNLVIVTGLKGYVYNTTLAQITDGDFIDARNVSYFNDRFLYDTPTGWAASDVGDPSTISTSNVVAITSTQDKDGGVLGVFSFGQKFYPFSKTTIESWWNPGGAVTFQREDFAFEQGVAGSYAHDNNSNFVYLLGFDRIPYRFSGLSKQSVGNSAIGQMFESFADVSDCKVICQTWDNENFIWFVFPSADRSFLLHEESNTWWPMAGDITGGRHAINQAIDVYDKKLICDHDNGNVYELSWSTYTNNGLPMYWERVTAPLNYKTFGLGSSRMFFQGVRIVLETGTAPATGQGSSPQLMLSWSTDNGNSFIGDIHLDCGVSGDRNREVIYHDGMGFIDPHENLMIKVRMTDPQRWAITDMQVNAEVGL